MTIKITTHLANIFVPKKDQCAQIIIKNDGTIKNAYPLPLISEIKISRKSQVFTKALIYNGDTTTYTLLKKVMSGKAALLLGGDSFEPLVYVFWHD